MSRGYIKNTHSFVTTDMAAESPTSHQKYLLFISFLFFAASKAAGNSSRISLNISSSVTFAYSGNSCKFPLNMKVRLKTCTMNTIWHVLWKCQYSRSPMRHTNVNISVVCINVNCQKCYPGNWAKTTPRNYTNSKPCSINCFPLVFWAE